MLSTASAVLDPAASLRKALRAGETEGQLLAKSYKCLASRGEERCLTLLLQTVSRHSGC